MHVDMLSQMEEGPRTTRRRVEAGARDGIRPAFGVRTTVQELKLIVGEWGLLH